MSQENTNSFCNDRDYYVVEFHNEITNGQMAMSVVPYTWLNVGVDNGVTCLWSNFKTDKEFNIAVSNKDEPQLENCRKCIVNIKYKTNSYEHAIERLKRLENESSLSGSSGPDDNDFERRTRRRIFKNSKYDNTVSDDEIPIIAKPLKQRVHQVSKRADKTSSDEEIQVPLKQKIHQTSKHDTLKNIQSNKIRQKSFSGQNINISDTNASADVTLVPESEPVYTFHQLQQTVVRTEDLVKRLITKVDILSSDLKYLTLVVQQPKEGLQRDHKDSDTVNNLPATSIECLQTLEGQLKDKQTFSDMCSSSLSIIGGRDGKETVRRLLAKILNHNLALAINWSGKNEKEAFKNYGNILKLVLAIARQNPLCNDLTAQEVESITKLWLRSAGDRMGGRDKRRSRQN